MLLDNEEKSKHIDELQNNQDIMNKTQKLDNQVLQGMFEDQLKHAQNDKHALENKLKDMQQQMLKRNQLEADKINQAEKRVREAEEREYLAQEAVKAAR